MQAEYASSLDLDSAQPTLTTPLGSAAIRFADCGHGELAYSIAGTSGSLPRTGTIPLTRLLSNVGCTPTGEANVPAATYAMSGIWADTSTQERGLVVDIDTHQNVLFAAWYTYTAQANVNDLGGQRWFTQQATLASPSATEAANISLYESSGGRFNATHPATTVPVGAAQFTLHSCSSAALTYQLTAGSNAGSIGSLELTRLGAVPPGCAL